MCFLPNFNEFGQMVLEKIFFKLAHHKQDGGHGNFVALNGFRGEDFIEIDKSETRIACGGHVNGTGRIEQSK